MFEHCNINHFDAVFWWIETNRKTKTEIFDKFLFRSENSPYIFFLDLEQNGENQSNRIWTLNEEKMNVYILYICWGDDYSVTRNKRTNLIISNLWFSAVLAIFEGTFSNRFLRRRQRLMKFIIEIYQKFNFFLEVFDLL